MNTQKNTTVGHCYQSPEITLIKLDQEISLSMLSYPEDPGDFMSVATPDYLIQNTDKIA
ncbi:MAG: hypothetical protein RBT57_05295 [Paludibacter sp.]|jgi:hypothetical protein|nr:hypothetical protein [Paludibacter sp.]